MEKFIGVVSFPELEASIFSALETYSNVHRGSGYASMITTNLFEHAREIVLNFLGLDKKEYIVVFCSPRRAFKFTENLKSSTYKVLSSLDIGLALGVRAVAVKRKSLPRGIPFETGGGTTKMISRTWEVWADPPDRFEAGTPAVINIIAFARALQLLKREGLSKFQPLDDKIERNSDINHLAGLKGKELLDELRKTLIGRDLIVPTMTGERSYINLDNSASTRTFLPVWKSFISTLSQTAQVHVDAIEKIKIVIANFLEAPLKDFDVIFTSNTTESINLAAESFKLQKEDRIAPAVLNTLLEHSSNDLPWRTVPGDSLLRVSVDKEGFLDLHEMERVLKDYNEDQKLGKERIRLVAVSGASNVLGTCNGLQEISKIAHRYGARVLVDGAQLIAHRKVSMARSGIDYLAFSAHKVYAPFGCGVLVVKKGLLTFSKSEMEAITASGEENVAGIAALGQALLLLEHIGFDIIREEEQSLTRMALNGMSKIPGIRIFGVKDPDSPKLSDKLGVIVFDIKKILPNKVAERLSLHGGIGVRYGCHCAHIIVKHVLNVPPWAEQLQRMILFVYPKLKFPGLVRISFGLDTTKEDVDVLLDTLGKIVSMKQDEAYRSAKVELQGIISEHLKSTIERVYK